jgi:glycosyltransferase involved in cell wall biosynthesis
MEAGVQQVHCHFASAMAQRALPAARVAGCGFTLTTHGYDVLRGPIANLGALIDAADGTVAVSQDIKRTLVERHGANAARITVQACGANTALFTPAAPDLAVPGRILTVARLSREKDLACAVLAAANLRRAGVAFEWEVIGEGPERAKLERLIGEHGLESSFRLLGARDTTAVRDAMAACSVFALCSVSEGAAVVLMEAMASMRPVVATAVGGLPELVLDEGTGLLVTAGRPDELAAALQRVLSDTQLAQRMGSAGHRRALESFSIGRQVDAVTGLWRRHWDD